MIQYTCPKCSSTVAADNNKAGQSHTCPNCGNMNVVPQAGPVGAKPQVGSSKAQAAAPEPAGAAEAEGQPAGEPAAQAATPQPAPAGALSDKDARMWGMFCHLGGLLVLTGVPFGNIVAPLIIWLIQKDKSPFIDDQGKEALNFQITVGIAMVISAVLVLAFIGAILLPAVIIANVVFVVMAAMKANEGVRYRYPWCFRFVK